jgi:hypothetical protein
VIWISDFIKLGLASLYQVGDLELECFPGMCYRIQKWATKDNLVENGIKIESCTESRVE